MTRGVLSSLPLPDGWHVGLFRSVVDRRREDACPDLEPLSVFLDEGVVPRSSRDDNFNVLGFDLNKYLVVRPGDLVFNRLRTWQGGLGVSSHEGIVSPVYFVCTPKPSVADGRYLHYLLRSRPYLAELTRISKWMPPAQFDIAWEDLRLLPILLPPLSDQSRIAAFLDSEMARTEALVRAKSRLADLLQERWHNEVVKTVTAGLRANPDVASLDSPWFSGLPDGWRLESLKRRWTVVDCKHRTPVYVDQGYALVSHAEIEDGRVYPGRSGRFVGEADYLDLIEGRRPKCGDIIYTRNAAIGNAGYVDTDEDFAMGQDVCLITSADEDQRFLTYFLNHVVVEQLTARRLGATFGRINVAQIVDLQILCPPSKEQRVIADHLDARRSTYEILTGSLRRQIERLVEHRQALITAIVTGQMALSREVA